MCDVRNYIDKPGEALSRLVSLSWGREPTDEDSDDEAILTCVNRCETLLEVIKRIVSWYNNHDFGKLELTTASCSMGAFKRLNMMSGIELPDEQSVRDLERAAYHAGRTEPLWIGTKRQTTYRPHPRALEYPVLFNDSPVGPFYILDSSSFYGLLYRECLLPKRLIYRGEGMDKEQARKLITDETWLATCRIVSKNIRWPFRDNVGSHSAVGRFTTTLCGPELLRAVQSGCIDGIGHFHRYHLDYTMRSFAEMMWSERQLAKAGDDKIIESWCKALIAMLHGKFAQRINKWQTCPELQADEPWTHWQHYSHTDNRMVNYRAIGYDVQMELPDGDARECFPAVAAWVTANGRELIAAWERVAGERNVLYVSTDSLIVTQRGYDNLFASNQIDNGDIGSLRILEKSDSVEIRGHGTYSIGNKIAMQGIAYNREQQIFGSVTQTKQSGIEYAICHKGTPRILIQHSEVEPGWNYDPKRIIGDGWLSPYHVVDNTVDFERRRTSDGKLMERELSY